MLSVEQVLRQTWLLDQDASLLALSSSPNRATRDLDTPVSNAGISFSRVNLITQSSALSAKARCRPMLRSVMRRATVTYFIYNTYCPWPPPTAQNGQLWCRFRGGHQVLKCRSVPGPNQSPMQQVPRLLSLGLSDRGVRITVHPYQLSRGRMTGAITLLPLYDFPTFQQLLN